MTIFAIAIDRIYEKNGVIYDFGTVNAPVSCRVVVIIYIDRRVVRTQYFLYTNREPQSPKSAQSFYSYSNHRALCASGSRSDVILLIWIEGLVSVVTWWIAIGLFRQKSPIPSAVL